MNIESIEKVIEKMNSKIILGGKNASHKWKEKKVFIVRQFDKQTLFQY